MAQHPLMAPHPFVAHHSPPGITIARPFAYALAAALMAGCPSSKEVTAPAKSSSAVPASKQPAADRGPGMPARLDSCPMVVAAVSSEVTDIEGGVALSFTTSGGDVVDLRRRVRETADMYRSRPHHRGWRWRRMNPDAPGRGRGPGPAGMRRGLGPMPPADISVEDVDGGARIVLRPVEEQRLGVLREHVRAHHERMRSRECPLRRPPDDAGAAASDEEP